MKPLKKSFFAKGTLKVAKALLGKILKYGSLSGMIVETEAYKGYPDMASHAAKRTKRSGLMFDSFGKFYIYFVYGNYFCLNVTTEDGKPGAVLIRALQPLGGIALMKKRRKTDNIKNLANGPGRLCQAFGIDKGLNGTDVNNGIKIFENRIKPKIVSTTRVGISKAKHLNWRFYIKGSEFISKK